MVAFLVRRLALAIFTMWAVSVLSFIIIQLPPGDYVTSYIAAQSASGSMVSTEEAANLRALYGLDQPGYVQYTRWISQVLQGKFGQSMEWGRPVAEVIGDRLALKIGRAHV